MIGTKTQIIKHLVDLAENNKKYEIKEYKEKRTLKENSYMHELINKLARYYNLSDEEMKIKLNLDYGTLDRFEDGRIKGCKVPKGTNIKEFYKYAKWYKTDEEGNDCYIFYKPTHELNTKEMTQLINGIIQECEDSGIETRPTSEIESLLKG